MPRLLAPEERALWRRVTADVRRARAIAAEEQPTPPTTITPSPAPPVTGAAPKPPPARRGLGAGTLDGRWDRTLMAGEVVPDRYVDLHGLGLDAAHRHALDAIDDAQRCGERVVVLVTGKPPPRGTTRLDMPLRGIIRASIGDWLAASAVASQIAAVRPAHPRHGGAGALYVILRRPARARG